MTKRRSIIITSSALGTVLAVAGIVALHAHPAKTPPTPSPALKNVVTKTLAAPSETKLTAENYLPTAAPNEPSYLSLPSIGTTGYVQKVGIDQYGQMAAPTNVNLAGWYVNSLLPGQAGLSIIDGHVDGHHHNEGIFGKLAQLHAGDTFSIRFGNGTSQSFAVTSVRLVAATDVPTVLFAHDPGITSQLNLITCGGDYDGVSHTYDKRTVVVSALIR